jgi:hypothetical protein
MFKVGKWTKYATQPDIITTHVLGNLTKHIGIMPMVTLTKYVEFMYRIKFDRTVSAARYYRLRPYLLRRITRQYGVIR